MKFMKRSLTLMLAGLMALSMVACGDKDDDTSKDADTSVASKDDGDGRELVGNTYKTGLPIVKEKETFSIFFKKVVNDISDDQNDKPLMQTLNEETNINIEWNAVGAGWDEQLSLLMATDATMPDMALSTPAGSIVQNNKKNMVDLTDMLEEWAPNIYAQSEEYLEDGVATYAKADGRIYSLPTGVYAEPANSVVGVQVINKNWLKNVGMEIPTTTEEFKTVLQAFRDKDANGNGNASDEIPALFSAGYWASNVTTYAGPWGIAGRNGNDYDSYYLLKDGVFTPTLNTQAFRDFLTYMHELSDEKLINSDAFTMETATYATLYAGDTVGLYGAWYDETDEWAPLPVLEAPGYEGQGVKQGEVGFRTAQMDGFFITRACDNPEAALRWWDEWHRDVYTKRVSRDGLPGEKTGLWVENDDGTATVNSPSEYPNGIDDDTILNYTVAFRGNSALMFGDEVAKPLAGSGTGDAIRYEYIDFYKDYLLDDFLPLYAVDDEQTDIKNEFIMEIEEYMDTFIANAVVSGEGLDDAGWQKHIDTLNNDLDLAGWVEWNQKYYDGEFKN